METEDLRQQKVPREDSELRRALKPDSVMKTLRQVITVLREKWLMQAGFGDEVRLDEHSFKTLADKLKSKDPCWVTTEQVNYIWEFTAWGFGGTVCSGVRGPHAVVDAVSPRWSR